MLAKLAFHPLGNADTIRIDLRDGRKMLVDYADMLNPADRFDARLNLPAELRRDLRLYQRDHYDVVVFTHLDRDHTCGASEFFWFDHAGAYQGEGRTRIRELWVPAGAITEAGSEGCARVIRQEARHRLRQGYGIRIFSRPAALKGWLEANGLTLAQREHLITDAGQLVPGFQKTAPEGVEFFIHSPYAWRRNEREVDDRNQDSVVFQATFREGFRDTRALFTADMEWEGLQSIVQITRGHHNDERLHWDLVKLPHHCSYLSLAADKGEDVTEPAEEVRWLYKEAGRARGIMVSTSDPIPTKGTPEDQDCQPPHRQAANYYKEVRDDLDGEFAVTMERPTRAKPRVTEIEITAAGAKLLSATVPAAAVISSGPVRAG